MYQMHTLYKMSVDIENKVIILDEAHNMEDSAREAASISVSNVQLLEISKEIKQLCECVCVQACVCVSVTVSVCMCVVGGCVRMCVCV